MDKGEREQGEQGEQGSKENVLVIFTTEIVMNTFIFSLVLPVLLTHLAKSHCFQDKIAFRNLMDLIKLLTLGNI
ncbi:hypothetical protein [Nostoc commune]|uniref:hypothetical protein n=1 Tax=Nostoc commune TaxID=1178 RepID=UPI0020746E02|nr:hypothetical protein [Nostoc commune]